MRACRERSKTSKSNPVSACPRLGTVDDPDTHYTFSSPTHRCYALGSPAEVDAGQQTDVCLGATHTVCPIFTGQETAPSLPIDTRPEAGEGRERKRGRGWLAGRKPQNR